MNISHIFLCIYQELFCHILKFTRYDIFLKVKNKNPCKSANYIVTIVLVWRVRSLLNRMTRAQSCM